MVRGFCPARECQRSETEEFFRFWSGNNKNKLLSLYKGVLFNTKASCPMYVAGLYLLVGGWLSCVIVFGFCSVVFR